jgi:SAM-dependent methyltransferase
MARPSSTILRGQADADRLARQAAVMAEATSAFLLAGAAGPGGRAVGLDLDPDALAIARQAAQRAGVAASFVCADATTPVTRQTFDLASARLLLSHLVEPSGCRWWLTAVSGTLTRWLVFSAGV